MKYLEDDEWPHANVMATVLKKYIMAVRLMNDGRDYVHLFEHFKFSSKEEAEIIKGIAETKVIDFTKEL